MLNQYFGYYLLNKGILTNLQLREILEAEQTVKVKLGVIAVNAGAMTAEQVEEIHNLQRTRDQKFGALAVEKEYLTSAQVEQLLESQQEGHLTLLQVIANKKYMTLTAVEQALMDFREEYETTDQTCDTDRLISKQMVDFSAAGTKADLLYNYIGLLKRNVLRFLNDASFIFMQITEHEKNVQWIASQQIIGDISLSTGFIMEESVLLEIASRFYGENLMEVDEMALDTVGEFLNVHNGIFCSSLSESGFITDLQTPFVLKKGKEPFRPIDYRVAIGTSFGDFEVILSVEE
jgi:CheY-specific phosphatase CheX